MLHSLAFGLSNLLGSSALSDVFRVCPFGILTVLDDCCPVGMAPPSGLMKLLVAPESKTALCPNISLQNCLGASKVFSSLTPLSISQSLVLEWVEQIGPLGHSQNLLGVPNLSSLKG